MNKAHRILAIMKSNMLTGKIL